MDARQLGQHTSHRFDDDLEAIRQKLLAAGGLVENQLKDALAALANFDKGMGEHVVSSDEGVNDLEVEIDQLCMEVIARRQPMASDLRLLIAAIKIINDLERMGDEAVRIARMAIRLTERESSDGRQFEVRARVRGPRGLPP